MKLFEGVSPSFSILAKPAVERSKCSNRRERRGLTLVQSEHIYENRYKFDKAKNNHIKKIALFRIDEPKIEIRSPCWFSKTVGLYDGLAIAYNNTVARIAGGSVPVVGALITYFMIEKWIYLRHLSS